ncbi:SH3 domain-containing protein [Pseudonocardia zijingensis]|uniref:SH3 domain-containing protein n=1 Tax=Pseudonocardia zijingensis TaxID=153376 RepID=A0ABN1QUM4_9PSEU
MARITVPKLEASSFKGWTFVLIAGVVLALLAIIDRGGLSAITVSDGSTGCQLEVTTDQLNVRNGPSPGAALIETLPRGTRVDGTRVVTDGFRQLEEGRWAASQFLTPLPGTNCA